jgi:hypothetical protein
MFFFSFFRLQKKRVFMANATGFKPCFLSFYNQKLSPKCYRETGIYCPQLFYLLKNIFTFACFLHCG